MICGTGFNNLMLGNNAHKFNGNTELTNAQIINAYQTAVQNNFLVDQQVIDKKFCG
jgi:hypothetical protein